MCTVWLPYKMMSTSMRRGPLRYDCCRPTAASIAFNSRSKRSGDSDVRSRHAAFKNVAWSVTYMGAVS